MVNASPMDTRSYKTYGLMVIGRPRVEILQNIYGLMVNARAMDRRYCKKVWVSSKREAFGQKILRNM